MAELLATANDNINSKDVFHHLAEREKLGSTGIGHGIALPHARTGSIKVPTIAILSLTDDVDYDAIDSLPVQLAVGLIVPQDADETHLKLLAELATLFSNEQLRNKILSCKQAHKVYALIKAWQSVTKISS